MWHGKESKFSGLRSLKIKFTIVYQCMFLPKDPILFYQKDSVALIIAQLTSLLQWWEDNYLLVFISIPHQVNSEKKEKEFSKYVKAYFVMHLHLRLFPAQTYKKVWNISQPVCIKEDITYLIVCNTFDFPSHKNYNAFSGTNVNNMVTSM